MAENDKQASLAFKEMLLKKAMSKYDETGFFSFDGYSSIESYYKYGVPGFAEGGIHSGGWRVVGENGPELENTGESRIFSNSQSKSLIDNTELINEIRQLRAELRAGNSAIANTSQRSMKALEKWDNDGMPAVRA
jgi:hypothetical protein